MKRYSWMLLVIEIIFVEETVDFGLLWDSMAYCLTSLESW